MTAPQLLAPACAAGTRSASAGYNRRGTRSYQPGPWQSTDLPQILLRRSKLDDHAVVLDIVQQDIVLDPVPFGEAIRRGAHARVRDDRPVLFRRVGPDVLADQQFKDGRLLVPAGK